MDPAVKELVKKVVLLEKRVDVLTQSYMDIIKVIQNFDGQASLPKNPRREPEAKSLHSNHLELIETSEGFFYVPKHAHADIIANAIRRNEVFEPKIIEVALRYIKEESIALDVGSNFGQMAVIMSQHVGKNGLVYAFDADDFVYTVLEKNIAVNKARVIPHFGAVHHTSGETVYFPKPDFEKLYQTYGSYNIDYVGKKGRPVQTLAIDEMS